MRYSVSALSRSIFTLGLLYQIYQMVTRNSTQISTTAFIIMAVGALLSYIYDNYNYAFTLSNTARVLDIILCFAIGYFTYYMRRTRY
jgi:uncharacterized protein with PQ loop repeat